MQRPHKRIPVGASQPVGIGTERPIRKPRKLKALGSFARPYERKDGIKTVKITFSISTEMAQRLQQFELKLKYEAEGGAVSRSLWFEEMIARAIKENFMLRKQSEPPPEGAPDNAPEEPPAP